MKQLFVGLDVHKETIAAAVAESGRDGEVRFWGNMPNSPAHIEGLLKAIGKDGVELRFVYEAGPCGYEVFRQLTGRGLTCEVVAPSHILRRPGDRVKNDHRDAVTLARLARAGELTSVWVPEPLHEAMRDLVRARHAANKDLKVARQRIQSFLLRHDRRYAAKVLDSTARNLASQPAVRLRRSAERVPGLHQRDGAVEGEAFPHRRADPEPIAQLVARTVGGSRLRREQRRCECSTAGSALSQRVNQVAKPVHVGPGRGCDLDVGNAHDDLTADRWRHFHLYERTCSLPTRRILPQTPAPPGQR